MRQFWVIGGVYQDTTFQDLAPGSSAVRQGPFETYDQANKAWQALAWSTVDDALAQYHIEEEELAENDIRPSFWVMGGSYRDGGFDKFDGAPERFGPFDNYEAAKSKWSELAWASVDDAAVRYRIETLTPKFDAPLKKRRYRLLTGQNSHEFCDRVSNALADGYQLYGNPAMTYTTDGLMVAQAVVLKDES